MSQILQCPSCGGSNQMPDGRNSMFCAFCGTVVQAQIQQPFSAANNSSLLSKPNITVKSFKGNTPWFQSSGERRVEGGIEYWDKIRDKWVFIEDEKVRTLSLTNRNISSIEEITSWFSDNELEEIDILNLSNNNITSLKGIERFKGLNELDLSKNRISSLSGLNKLGVRSLKLNLSDNCFEILDDMVRFNLASTSSASKELIINLSNNLVLKGISDDVVNSLNSNSNYFYHLSFNFEGCNEFDIQLINKINFRNILIKENTTDDDTINCFVSIISPLCTDYAPQLIANNNSTKSDSNDNISNSNTRDKSNKPNVIQNIFGRLNILDWIALVTPIILATIISQSDSNKDSGLGFWDFLLGFLVLAIIFRFYPFFSRKEKTGRSFESKHGTLHEYRTVEGKVNTEHGFWIVSLIHVITIALIIYFHGFGSSKSENQSSSIESTSSQSQSISPVYESNSSSTYSDTVSKESNTNVQSPEINQNENFQAEQTPVENNSIETNSNNNGLKQLMMLYYQSMGNNTFDANNYFLDEVKQYERDENLTPSQINKKYEFDSRIYTNYNIQIVNNLINFKEKNGNIATYTFDVDMSFFDRQYEYYDTREYAKVTWKNSVEVGYDLQRQKLISYKTSWGETNYEIHGKKYSSSTKLIKSKIIKILESKYKTRNMGIGFLVLFDAFKKPIEVSADYKPVVGDTYLFRVHSWEKNPYSMWSSMGLSME